MNPDPKQIFREFKKKKETLEKRLEKLAVQVSAEDAFLSYYASKALPAAGNWNEAQHGSVPTDIELAAYNLYPYFGRSTAFDGGIIQEVCVVLDELKMIRPLASIDHDSVHPSAHLVARSRLHSEVVRGSAYPVQTEIEILNILCPFDAWFETKAGISPSRVLSIVKNIDQAASDSYGKLKEFLVSVRDDALAKLSQETYSEDEMERDRSRFQAVLDYGPRALAVSFDQIVARDPKTTLKEWQSLKNLLGFTTQYRAEINTESETQLRPLYFISEDRALFLDYSTLYDGIFTAYETWARSDTEFYDKRYLLQRKAWTEKTVVEYLRRVFPNNSIIENVQYSDPDHDGGEAEMDAIVVWGPFLVLVEVKGSQFKFAAQRGDLKPLKRAVQENIHSAFLQTKRFLKYYDLSENPHVKEKGSGKVTTIDKTRIIKCFQICVSLHHLQGIATQLSQLKSVGLFQRGEYPWSVSLGDLDLITLFSKTPDVFLHYIHRRIEINEASKIISCDEMDLFGAYLSCRLDPNQFLNRKTDDGEDYTMLQLTGFTDQFDKWAQAEMEQKEANKPKIELELPSVVKIILEVIRQKREDASAWLAFAILNLSQDGISRLEDAIIRVKEVKLKPRQRPRISFEDGGVSVTVIGFEGFSGSPIEGYLTYRTNVQKYKTKLDNAIGLAIDVDNPMYLYTACWIQEPWEKDEGMEDLVS